MDTAIDYGRSEKLIGRHLAHRQAQYTSARKCGCVAGERIGSSHVHTAHNILQRVEHSLRLMKTDYLDLVQFHKSLTPDEFRTGGALEELLNLRDEGKVRYIGVSGFSPNLESQMAMGVFDAFQMPYSAMQQEHEDVISRASDAGVGTIILGGVARGAPDDWNARSCYMVTTEEMQRLWDRARLDELAGEMSRVDFLLRFALAHPGVDTIIVGTQSVDHMNANVATAILLGPLPADLHLEAQRRLESERRDGDEERLP